MTSEYVSLGHPDKTADFISEWILDAALRQDPAARYAVEVQIKDNVVNLAGEMTTKAELDLPALTREAVEDIGYTREYAAKWGEGNCIDPARLQVNAYISRQSPDIAQGVDKDTWGDQGIFWGMSTPDDSTDYMPRDYWLARRICQELYRTRLGGLIGIDIKTQVATDQAGNPREVVVAAPALENAQAAEAARRLVNGIVGFSGFDFIFNGTGKYVKHSSFGDSGTTGRKLAVDFYGGNCIVGGGSPWTKDGTKADLALNLYARFVAKEWAVKTGQTVYAALSTSIGSRVVRINIADGGLRPLLETEEEITPSMLAAKFKLRQPVFAEMCKKGLFLNV